MNKAAGHVTETQQNNNKNKKVKTNFISDCHEVLKLETPSVSAPYIHSNSLFV